MRETSVLIGCRMSRGRERSFRSGPNRDLEIEADEDELVRVVSEHASVGCDNGATNVHERVQRLGKLLLVGLAVEADDNAAAVELIVGELHQVDKGLSVEPRRVRRGEVVERLGVVGGRREDGGISGGELLDGLLREPDDLDAVLAELVQVARTEDRREEAGLVDGRRNGRSG